MTACRSGEVRGAKWCEIGLEGRVWTVPAERMKAGKEHRVPLSQRALEVLNESRELTDGPGLVFPSPTGKQLSDSAVSKLMRENGIDAVPHGFRSSFRDWCGDNGVAREVAAATPVAVVTTNAVRSTWVSGELNEQFAKHYLGVEIVDTGQPATIKMVYDPQDSQQVDDSSGFYVFKQTGYDRYLNASPPSDSVFLTGSLESMDGIKRKVVEVSVDDVSDIVALVTYNDTTMAFSYTLTGENILFLDDSGEQVEGDRVVVQQPADGTSDPPAAVGTDIAPGSSYTVQTGDTLGTISLRAYGSTTNWSAICTANSLTNCDIIESGDVLTIPILAQTDTSGTGGTATPAATAAATADAMPEATAAATAAATAEAMPEATAAATPEATAEAMPEPTSQAETGGSNLIEVAEDYEQLDILLLALDLAGLSATIADGGPYTIFAPTNAAFASLPEARLDMLMADSALLAETLKFHVVSGSLKTTDLASLSTLTTLQGGTIDVNTGSDGALSVEGISIVTSDVEASNGVIHFIHQLLPDPDENN